MSALNAEQQRMVLDATVKLASQQELSSITLDQLTKACGVPAFDIVRQYHSKEGILAAYALLEDGRTVLLHLGLGPRGARMPGW